MTIPRILKQCDSGPIVAMFFCGDGFALQRSKILDSCPSQCTILAADADSSHDEAMLVALSDELARRGPGPKPVWLVGYSAGGHRVRDCLGFSHHIDTVITCDATHGSLESRPQTMPLKPWLDLGERAERGDVRWLSSHTYNTYTESLGKEGPFYSTVTVMRRASRQLLPEPPTGQFTRTDVGKLSIWSYESGSCDGAAHARQVREVLPLMLREATRELGELPPIVDLGDTRSPLELVHERLHARLGRQPTNAELAVGRAQAWLEMGVHEIAGPQSHPMIAAALRRCVRGGKPLGLSSDEVSWCAAAASDWRQLRLPRCAVHELVEDARLDAAGTWRDVASGYTPQPGDLEVYSRDGNDPRKGGLGHVAIVVGDADRIGGNESNAVRLRSATLPGQAVVGWITT